MGFPAERYLKHYPVGVPVEIVTRNGMPPEKGIIEENDFGAGVVVYKFYYSNPEKKNMFLYLSNEYEILLDGKHWNTQIKQVWTRTSNGCTWKTVVNPDSLNGTTEHIL